MTLISKWLCAAALVWTFNAGAAVYIAPNSLSGITAGAPGVAGARLCVDPFTGSSAWMLPLIADEFDLYGVAVGQTFYNAISASANNGAAGTMNVVPGALPKNAYNGFYRLEVYATNGVGSGMQSAMRYWTTAQRWTFQTNTLFETEVGFESQLASNIVYIGWMNCTADTNVTAGVFWEWNPQFVGSQVWRFRCVSGNSATYTATFPGTLNTWTKLGFKGDTNSIVAYTNGVAAFTNTDNTTMAGGKVAGWQAFMFNGKTNDIGTGMTHDMYINYFNLWRY